MLGRGCWHPSVVQIIIIDSCGLGVETNTEGIISKRTITCVVRIDPPQAPGEVEIPVRRGRDRWRDGSMHLSLANEVKYCWSESRTNKPKKGDGRGVMIGLCVGCDSRTLLILANLICLVVRVIVMMWGSWICPWLRWSEVGDPMRVIGSANSVDENGAK